MNFTLNFKFMMFITRYYLQVGFVYILVVIFVTCISCTSVQGELVFVVCVYVGEYFLRVKNVVVRAR